jgi:hypothetical protein
MLYIYLKTESECGMKHFKGIILFLLLIALMALPVFAQDDNETCATENHPAANRLAEAFDVEVSEIIDLHCAGTGFGEIARIYRAAELSDTLVADIIAMRAEGMGWGRIARELGFHPSDLAPGRIVGNGNGRGNGNANGNANGNGNGRGNGNANGNGNGRGRGRGGSSGGSSGGSD